MKVLQELERRNRKYSRRRRRRCIIFAILIDFVTLHFLHRSMMYKSEHKNCISPPVCTSSETVISGKYFDEIINYKICSCCNMYTYSIPRNITSSFTHREKTKEVVTLSTAYVKRISPFTNAALKSIKFYHHKGTHGRTKRRGVQI
jgi:hypothetical protein